MTKNNEHLASPDGGICLSLQGMADPRMAERLRNMVELFLDKIIDKNTYHLINFMDRNWNRTSQVDSYGHDIECSWLLHEAASLLGDEQLLKRVEETSVKMAETVVEAIQPDGSIVYEKDLATGHVQTDRSWWAEVETIVGYFNAWEISGNEKYLELFMGLAGIIHVIILWTKQTVGGFRM